MRFPLFLLPALALAASAPAQAPVDLRTMLSNLQEIKAKHQQATRSAANQTIRDFSAAAATAQAAVAFYQQAIQVTQFAGVDHEQTALHDWKKKEADMLRSAEFGASAQTCLAYMTISMQRASGVPDAQIIPALINYAQQTDAQASTVYDQPLVKAAISDNVFAKWYRVGDQLRALENWEMVPQNTDGIYTRTILPWMRKNRDPRIVQYWDNKIARAGSAASAGQAFKADVFANTVKPSMLWSRATDMLAVGLRDQAIATMYTIIRTYPAHKDAEQWIDQLQGILSPSASSVPGGPPPPPGAPR